MSTSKQTFPYSPPTVFVFALLVLLAGGALLSACDSDSDNSGSEDSLVGTYSLLSLRFGEETVPRADIIDAQLTLFSDGSWRAFFELEEDFDSGIELVNGRGRYTVNGDQQITFSVNESNEDDLDDIVGTVGEISGEQISIEMEIEGEFAGYSAVVERD